MVVVVAFSVANDSHHIDGQVLCLGMSGQSVSLI